MFQLMRKYFHIDHKRNYTHISMRQKKILLSIRDLTTLKMMINIDCFVGLSHVIRLINIYDSNLLFRFII